MDEVLREPAVQRLAGTHGRGPVLRHLRLLLDEARRHAGQGDQSEAATLMADLPARLAGRLEAAGRPSLARVINATGVVIHTNLGRAPLPAAAVARVAEIAGACSNLEYDLERGQRGNREVHAERRLLAMLGAEGSVVVNNNAAAVLLAVNTLAEGREVLVSRGELVEIGGSFRIPDVVRKSGARLRDVGTTNRTRLADYREALGPETALILKVHPSNFRMVGFVESASRRELVGLAAEAGVPLVEDLGSGLLAAPATLEGEEDVEASLAAGVDLVTFSGDKLLGGPQAGLAVGRRAVTEAMRRNPLYRALRVDKMTLAALDAVLAAHESGRAEEEVPVLRMLAAPAAAVRARAEAMAAALRAGLSPAEVEVRDGASAVGGGAAPALEVPTALLALSHPERTPDELAAALRARTPPVVARVAGDRLLVDLRTVLPEDEPALLSALKQSLSG